jgi:dGTPase
MSPRLRVAEQRGRQIVAEIFGRLADENGHLLLPEDFRAWFLNLKTKPERMRIICDFIAGMTDRYAVEFHARLTSETPQSMFKPI